MYEKVFFASDRAGSKRFIHLMGKTLQRNVEPLLAFALVSIYGILFST